VLVSRSLCREHLVPDPAHEPITTSCESAWLGRSHLAREEHTPQLRNDKSRALRDARRSESREEPALHGETGTIAHSCANVWKAKFADLEVALAETRPAPAASRGGQVNNTVANPDRFLAFLGRGRKHRSLYPTVVKVFHRYPPAAWSSVTCDTFQTSGYPRNFPIAAKAPVPRSRGVGAYRFPIQEMASVGRYWLSGAPQNPVHGHSTVTSIAGGERIIAHQRAIITNLKSRACDTQAAEDLLEASEATQSLHVADRDHLLKAL
jgi:hypothetical protein